MPIKRRAARTVSLVEMKNQPVVPVKSKEQKAETRKILKKMGYDDKAIACIVPEDDDVHDL